MTTATKASTAELLDRLTSGIAELTTSEAWVRYLDLQARLPRYSFGNCLLIARARPDATMVAGFHTWKGLGRWPRKGERGIRILAPVTGRRKHEQATDEEPTRHVVGFRSVVVFDVAQTDGREVAESPCHRLSGDAPETAFDHLTRVARGLGFTVEATADLPGERNGDCSHQARRIRIRADRSPAQRCKTLAHEIAHAILHADGLTAREVAELEAEATAYIVCSGIGLDSSDYSLGYAATWAGGGDQAIQLIRHCGNRIQGSASKITEALQQR